MPAIDPDGLDGVLTELRAPARGPRQGWVVAALAALGGASLLIALLPEKTLPPVETRHVFVMTRTADTTHAFAETTRALAEITRALADPRLASLAVDPRLASLAIDPRLASLAIEAAHAEGLVHFGRNQVLPLFDAAALRPFLDCERVQLVGHTCSLGGEEVNLQVGLARARSVQRVLAAMGYDPARIDVASRGSREPIASNATSEGRSANRRVTLACISQRSQP
jgi:hypothetical protein